MRTACLAGYAKKLARTVLLVSLASLGTVALTRLAPGYYADAREMDAQTSAGARSQLEAERRQDSSLTATILAQLGRYAHGDLGRSRQYDIPVAALVLPRLSVTGALLLRGVACGSLCALALALPLSARPARSNGAFNNGEILITASTACLLALPVGAMATFCLLSGTGGPALVLAVLVGTRSFKFLYHLLRNAWQAPHLLQARAQGVRPIHLACAHLFPAIRPQLLALFTMSLVTALSAAVPVEVIFNVPGVGQLAWSAASNRDLPVLVAVTMVMAIAVGCSGMLAEPGVAANPAATSGSTSGSMSGRTSGIASGEPADKLTGAHARELAGELA